jgi:hypothetical protein
MSIQMLFLLKIMMYWHWSSAYYLCGSPLVCEAGIVTYRILSPLHFHLIEILSQVVSSVRAAWHCGQFTSLYMLFNAKQLIYPPPKLVLSSGSKWKKKGFRATHTVPSENNFTNNDNNNIYWNWKQNNRQRIQGDTIPVPRKMSLYLRSLPYIPI